MTESQEDGQYVYVLGVDRSLFGSYPRLIGPTPGEEWWWPNHPVVEGLEYWRASITISKPRGTPLVPMVDSNTIDLWVDFPQSPVADWIAAAQQP